jgi:AbiV family abortive infection protein
VTSGPRSAPPGCSTSTSAIIDRVTRGPLPSKEECRQGIALALNNADEHFGAADLLARGGRFGFAVAHLVYALEESEKARTLGKVVIGDILTEDELRSALRDHRARHIGAVGKSWTSGAVALFMQSSKEGLLERLNQLPARAESDRWEDILAAHPEVLPEDWSEQAGPTRERGLYVDFAGTRWSSPSDATEADFRRLRPAVGRQLAYIRAAYEREVLAAAQHEV